MKKKTVNMMKGLGVAMAVGLSLIHISEPTRRS